jgi:hypothetical protein
MQPFGGAIRFIEVRAFSFFSTGRFVGAFAVAFSAFESSLPAQEASFTNDGAQGSLIELYSSEGCSSCPPAEAALGRLADSPQLWKEIFPVAFHVDYWDGLGWPDRFARPQYTQRQRDYADRLHQDSVYTPEFVVDGAEFRGWFHGQPWPSASATSGRLSLALHGGQLRATYAPGAKRAAPDLLMNAALLGFHVVSDVQRGENGGRVLTHDFVVLAFGSTPLATGSATLNLVPANGEAPRALVGWVSRGDGSIVQLAGGWLK